MGDHGNAGPPHLLSLKVMRLSRPAFVQTNPIPFDDSDPSLPGHPGLADLLHLDSPVAQTPTRSQQAPDSVNLRDFGLSDLLALPPSFGNIYLGETFSSYLCINNESQAATQDVGIKAELQTGSQRFTLTDTVASTTPRASISLTDRSGTSTPTRVPLLPTQSAEFVIQHEIKELGVHILVCSVHYSTPAGEKRFFRKFYKFQVLNPLAVKTKVNSLPDGKVFLEAQVQNMAAEPMFLERMRFDPSDLFVYTDLNSIIPRGSESDSSSPTTLTHVSPSEPLGVLNTNITRPNPTPANPAQTVGATEEGSIYLNPQDIRQYLYMLNPKKPHDPVARTSPTLGKLDIMWRTHLGQTGRLQTSQLSRKVPPTDPYEMAVVSVPDRIVAEQPFSMTCRVYNNLVSETLRLTLSGIKANMSSILLMGASERAFGNVPPLEHVDVTLQFFPLLAGLHKVSGFRLSEMVSGTSKDINHLTDLFVWP
ncbi:uncharacterized protein EV422DRAFT_493224 [Fimicolochytrium jonesii]|uniref:uncharacterized protein n=1 Tax=Fimicolochytrium jonesii TaxID=1396493 RepID=UPI0022FECC73|nr:uncharacterized protein EV422DRAFT_493224 [Fimicolochytrium jonesii]KAI8824058.1 hypothetical protein EV422DRAFT_493224 [Fimicolochytrium jonesii]